MKSATLATLNMRELDRLKMIQSVVDMGLKPGRAAECLGLTVRQAERQVNRYWELVLETIEFERADGFARAQQALFDGNRNLAHTAAIPPIREIQCARMADCLAFERPERP